MTKNLRHRGGIIQTQQIHHRITAVGNSLKGKGRLPQMIPQNSQNIIHHNHRFRFILKILQAGDHVAGDLAQQKSIMGFVFTGTLANAITMVQVNQARNGHAYLTPFFWGDY